MARRVSVMPEERAAANARRVQDIVITEDVLSWEIRQQLARNAPAELTVPSGRAKPSAARRERFGVFGPSMSWVSPTTLRTRRGLGMGWRSGLFPVKIPGLSRLGCVLIAAKWQI